jgi:hypothetical protein
MPFVLSAFLALCLLLSPGSGARARQVPARLSAHDPLDSTLASAFSTNGHTVYHLRTAGVAQQGHVANRECVIAQFSSGACRNGQVFNQHSRRSRAAFGELAKSGDLLKTNRNSTAHLHRVSQPWVASVVRFS